MMSRRSTFARARRKVAAPKRALLAVLAEIRARVPLHADLAAEMTRRRAGASRRGIGAKARPGAP